MDRGRCVVVVIVEGMHGCGDNDRSVMRFRCLSLIIFRFCGFIPILFRFLLEVFANKTTSRISGTTTETEADYINTIHGYVLSNDFVGSTETGWNFAKFRLFGSEESDGTEPNLQVECNG